MRDLDWWEIGVRGLKIPIAQLSTLLVASLPPVVIAVLIYLADPPLFRNDGLYRYLIEFVCFTIFEWCWMTALWHTTLRHAAAFLLNPSFWSYSFAIFALALGGVVPAIGMLLPRLLFLSDIAFGLGIAVSVALTLIVLWVWLRLAIWPAAIIAQHRMIHPARIWRMTKGLSIDFLLLTVFIKMPIFVLGLIAYFALGIVEVRVDQTWIGPAVVGGLKLYFTAAWSAAILLAYHDVVMASSRRSAQILGIDAAYLP